MYANQMKSEIETMYRILLAICVFNLNYLIVQFYFLLPFLKGTCQLGPLTNTTH